MGSLRQLNLWLHLLAASVWIGISACLLSVWLPQVHSRMDSPSWGQLLVGLSRRYVLWAWLAIHILLLTGIFNLLSVGIESAFSFPPAFLKRLIAKLSIVLVMIGIQIGLALVWMPRLARGSSGGGEARAILRALISTTLAGGAALWLAMTLTRW